MKKLMIAAAIACAAAFAQAGAISWTVLNLTASPDTTSKADASYKAYLFTGTDVAGMTALLDAGDFATFESKALASMGSTYVPATSMINIIGGNAGDFKSQEVSAFAIIVNAASAADASYYQVAKGGTGGSGVAGEEIITKTFGATGGNNYAWGQQNNNTQWTAVPEPTSGLLLLLGVAGLALKRKRA